MAVAQFPDSAQKFRGGADHATFAQDRFQDHRAGPLGDRRGESGQVVERDMRDARRQRFEALGVFGLAADGDGEQGAAVKRGCEGDDLALVRSGVVGGVFAGHECRLIGFGAGLAKNTRWAKVSSHSRRASLRAGSLVSRLLTCQSLRACSVSAATSFGWAWPSTLTAMPPAKSMYSRPS